MHDTRLGDNVSTRVSSRLGCSIMMPHKMSFSHCWSQCFVIKVIMNIVCQGCLLNGLVSLTWNLTLHLCVLHIFSWSAYHMLEQCATDTSSVTTDQHTSMATLPDNIRIHHNFPVLPLHSLHSPHPNPKSDILTGSTVKCQVWLHSYVN